MLTGLGVLTSPIWLSLIFALFCSKCNKIVRCFGAAVLSIPHILLIGAMGVMLFDAPGSENNPTAWLFYFSMVFGPPVLGITLAYHIEEDK